MTKQKIVPNIWCNGNAEEVGEYYASVFPGATSSVDARYPTEGLLDFQRPLAGEPLTVGVMIEGTLLRLINAGDDFTPNPTVSFMLNFDPLMFGGDAEAAKARLNNVWRGLADGGTVFMDIGEYPFSKRYGWVQDRFGVSWQLILTNPDGDPRPFVVPSIMFGAGVQNRAAEAIDFYASVFADAKPGSRYPYGTPTGPASAEALMFAEFRVGDQWFTAMDSGVEQAESFTPGISLEVQCADQDEIDRLWGALSAVPEAEQCGWLVDRFGLSWQIVPADMEQLMQRPDAFPHLLGMKKIVISEL